MYFKSVRKFSNRELAALLRYDENYLTRVRSGDVEGGEKLLHALETFFQLDNLKRISQIDRQIMELQRSKTVLQEQTVESFYAARRIASVADKHPEVFRGVALNESGPNSAKTIAEGIAAAEAKKISEHKPRKPRSGGASQ